MCFVQSRGFKVKIASMTSLDIENKNRTREHEQDVENSRERNITIKKRQCVKHWVFFSLKSFLRDERATFDQETEEQVSDIRRELVNWKPYNKSATHF